MNGGAERLQQADVVLFDALADPALRALAPTARWIDVGKRGFVGVPHAPGGGRENTGQETINALLVSIGAPRLERLGFEIPSPISSPEHRLYELLAAEEPDSAHARYNALIRRLVSFERAAESAS